MAKIERAPLAAILPALPEPTIAQVDKTLGAMSGGA